MALGDQVEGPSGVQVARGGQVARAIWCLTTPKCKLKLTWSPLGRAWGALMSRFVATWWPLGDHLEPKLGQEAPRRAPRAGKLVPSGVQEAASCAQYVPKSLQVRPKRRPRASQGRRGSAQEPPKSGQERVKSGQDRPKSDQERPKRLPKACKLSPKGVQDPLQNC